jgi:hypothetical protein
VEEIILVNVEYNVNDVDEQTTGRKYGILPSPYVV